MSNGGANSFHKDCEETVSSKQHTVLLCNYISFKQFVDLSSYENVESDRKEGQEKLRGDVEAV